MNIPINHPWIGKKVVDSYGRQEIIKSYIGFDFGIEFEHVYMHKTEKETARMIKRAEEREKENNQNKENER